MALDPNVPPRPPGPHPAPEQLYRARLGPRTAEAERWLAHAAACAACSEELLRQEAFDEPDPVSPGRLAGAWDRFGEPAERPPIASRFPAVPPRTAPWLVALAATAAAAVAGLGVWTVSNRPQPQPRPAAQPATAHRVRGGAEAAGTWLPAGPLDAPPSEIVFPAANGEAQRVTVFDAGHTYTWTSPPTVDGKVLFPAGERQRLKKGVDYYWTVIGQEEMAARSFRLR